MHAYSKSGPTCFAHSSAERLRPTSEQVRVSSQGEPVDGVDPELVDEFRAAAAGADVTVEPDALGPAGAGMLLVLPRD